MKLFVKHLTHIDSSILDQEYGVLGQSWIVDIVLKGALNHEGMIMDFGDVKKQIKDIIDQTLDHTLLVPANSDYVSLSNQGDEYYLEYQCAKGLIKHRSPFEAISLLPCSEINIETVTEALLTIIKPKLPAEVHDLSITLRNEVIDGAAYCYSHGLKTHGGNCQRIAHGHRSSIEVLTDGERNYELETSWAKRWHGQYIGTEENIIDNYTDNNVDYYRFAYKSSQGEFTLDMPVACCDIIISETTVELLAQHICKELSKDSDHVITVHAYEGVDKGAVANTLEIPQYEQASQQANALTS